MYLSIVRKFSGLLLASLLLLTMLYPMPFRVQADEVYLAQDVVNWANAQVGNLWENNYCLAYVATVFNQAYGFDGNTYSSCCAFQNGNRYIISSSRSDIPLGSCVYFGGSGVVCGCGNYAGHIALYVGNNSIVHAWDGRIKCDTIDYVINCGYPYRGYGWYANQELIDGSAYLLQCTKYPSYGMIEITKDNANIMDRPCSTATDSDSTLIESGVLDAEYTVTGLYENTVGNYWYRVITKSGKTGYIYSENCQFTSGLFLDVELKESSIPTELMQGVAYNLGGTVSSPYSQMSNVSFWVYDSTGEKRTGNSVDVSGNSYKLSEPAIDYNVVFNNLPTGNYECVVTATVTAYFYNAKGKLGVKHDLELYRGNLTIKDPAQIYHTLTFDANGGTVTPTTMSILNGSNPGKLPIPVWGDEYFAGWFTAAVGGTQVTAETAINTSQTVYAHWGCTHQYTMTETTPGCTEFGEKLYRCSICGDSYSESIAALGHSYGDWTVDTAATCTETGLEIRTCATCGDIATQIVAATGHSYISEVIQATCSDYEKTRYICTVCGDTYSEYSELVYSEWSTVLPDGVDENLIETKTEYRYRDKITTTSTNSALDGWIFQGTTYGEWGSTQTTTNKPSESDILRITATTQTGWGYYHWCNYYYNGGNNWNIDSIQYGSPCYWHSYISNIELPAISFPDQGGNQAYGGTGTGAYPCEYNFYIWFRNPDADVYTYTYETRELTNHFYKWSEWSNWSETVANESDDRNIEIRNVYRYVTSELADHQYTSSVISPTFTEKGYSIDTCVNCGDVVSTELPCLIGDVEQWNIELENDLKVNFYLYVSEEIYSTAKVKISIGQTENCFAIAELEKAENGRYVAKVCVVAAQMNDSIIVQVINGKNSGVEYFYSVRQYCETILADEKYSQYHQLVKQMLSYGGAAQSYFNYDADNRADAAITGVAAEEIPADAEGMTVSGTVSGISYRGASLLFRDKIAVRFYFTGDVTGCSIQVNGESCEITSNGEMHYVEVGGILPQNLDQQITLTVTDAHGNTLTVCYGAMDYIVRMNEKGSSELQNLLKALYNYHLAAKAFAEQQP